MSNIDEDNLSLKFDMIYQWFNPYQNYASYGGKEESDKAAIRWNSPILGNPLPPLSQWKTPVLTQFVKEGKVKSNTKIIADCVSAGSTQLINQKSADALVDIWEEHTILYPVVLDDKPDEPYYMVVVKTVIDCIDRERSRGTINEWSRNGKQGYFDGITQWVFRENEIGDNYMFVLPDSASAIYLTESFRQRVIDASLTGFGFSKELYDDAPFIS